MSNIECFPRLAVVLPHPAEPETYAIDANTGTLPGVRVDTEGLIDERMALGLAHHIGATGEHSIDRTIRAFPALSLFVMKPAKGPTLRRPYAWERCSIEAVKAVCAEFHGAPYISQEEHDVLQERAMKMLSIFTIMSSIKGKRAVQVTQSFFCEEKGMYELPYASKLIDFVPSR